MIYETMISEATRLGDQSERLSRFVLHLNSFENVDYWIIQIPVGLVAETRRLIGNLRDVVLQKDLSQLAWIARNALELNIWARYATSSTECAKRFHQDAYVDAVELLKLMPKVVENVSMEVGMDLPPVLRQMVKTQNSTNGELGHGIVS